MRRHLSLLVSSCLTLSFACLTFTLAMAATVGSGAPTPTVMSGFINAYLRGPFALLTLNPLADVHALGSPGYVQEFSARVGSGTYALIKPDPTAVVSTSDTLQVYNDIYPFFLSIGVANAGYPTNDTTVCPANGVGTCDYQLFTKDYALFAYSAPAMNVSVSDPFYTVWAAAGGVGGLFGVPAGAPATVTSISKATATRQVFDSGALFSYPVGSATATVYSVTAPAYAVYVAAGGYTTLGLPTTQALATDTAGSMRQKFENGRIEWSTTQAAVALFNLAEVDVVNAGAGLSLASGATTTISALALDNRGSLVTGRSLTWSTTNGQVVSVVGNGYTAVLHAGAPGAADIYVSGEGKTSAALHVTVGSACCGVGEGAPNQGITQAFQDAVTRNGLSVALPVAQPVSRVGTGYVQFLSAGTAYAVAQADGSSFAYVLSGAIYAAYLANGGFTGTLGYPASDPIAGAQKFTSGAAIGGNPAHVVPAVLAAKWFLAGGPAGVAGLPVADAIAVASATGTKGVGQAFAAGAIYAASGGIAFLTSGPIFVRYVALGTTSGVLGFPTSDLYNTGSASIGTAAQAQNFEGGYIDLQMGAAAAVEHVNPRHPSLVVSPGAVAPGGRVHVSAMGFAPGASLVFTLSNGTGFTVPTAAGAFAYDIAIPAGAKAGTVSVSVAGAGGDVAAGSYTVMSVAGLLPRIAIVSGDRQSAAPGSLVPAPIVAVLMDSAGNPVPGVAVTGSVSPGAGLVSTFITDAAGRVSVSLRLPPVAGAAVGSLAAGGQVADFSALAVPVAATAFPAFAQGDAQSGFTAAFAALLRFYQNAGAIGSPNGLATVAALGQYLTAKNGFAASDAGIAVVNPWVAAAFAGAGLSVEAATVDRIHDLVGNGTPVLAVLRLTVDGALAGSAAVDVTGVGADGSPAIADPNPAYGRVLLSDYVNGFSSGNHSIMGALDAVLRLQPAAANGGAFVVASPGGAGAVTASAAGVCPSLAVLEPATGAAPVSLPGAARFQYCDGSQAAYEIDLSSSKAISVVDLSGGPSVALAASGTVAFQVTRVGGALRAAPQTFSVTGVTDSAAFTGAVAPGELISIFGTGLGAGPAVFVGGQAVPVIAAFPFQLNAVLPVGVAAGQAVLKVSSALGATSQAVTIVPVAPEIFTIGLNGDGSAQGAIVNVQDGSINGPGAPAQRTQFVSVYCTGLGATTVKAGLATASVPVSVVVNGVSVGAAYAGVAPGFVGLYQVNVAVPAGLSPTTAGTLVLQQGGRASNTVSVAIQ